MSEAKSLYGVDSGTAELDGPTLEAVVRVLDARADYLLRVIDVHDGEGWEADSARQLLHGVRDAATLVRNMRGSAR